MTHMPLKPRQQAAHDAVFERLSQGIGRRLRVEPRDKLSDAQWAFIVEHEPALVTYLAGQNQQREAVLPVAPPRRIRRRISGGGLVLDG